MKRGRSSPEGVGATLGMDAGLPNGHRVMVRGEGVTGSSLKLVLGLIAKEMTWLLFLWPLSFGLCYSGFRRMGWAFGCFRMVCVSPSFPTRSGIFLQLD